ncbi:hypothetical protein FLJC2902T_25640 [Flavobacterium limnosediminis JC2902]|uniref:Uncharacterized protein n=1 Tax=Flavobacterium limnosediminis JC2902 TaxID=1341181 RepID=V6SJ14_9FLAO|nr:hypothetical protein [Flavobacterium limnosediminis]ESU26591.1 hypothetical protein FLJC2902T_25640 [Flavobacterium limnosediminis JC2902]
MVNIVLFLFIAFLATPTVVGMLKSDTDTSMFYSLSEEEIQKEVKEIPLSIAEVIHLETFYFSRKATAINFQNEQKHDNVSEEIFSPPPEKA